MCGTQSLRHLKTFTKVTSPLGSRAAMRVGSSPFRRTSLEILITALFPASLKTAL